VNGATTSASIAPGFSSLMKSATTLVTWLRVPVTRPPAEVVTLLPPCTTRPIAAS